MDKKRVIIPIFCLAVFIFSSTAHAAVIAIVKSREIPLYGVMLKSFRSYLEKGGVSATFSEYSLEEKDKAQIAAIFAEIKTKNPILLLNLGTTAAKNAQEMAKDLPMVFSMILNPAQSNIAAPGVSMDIPFEAKLGGLKRIMPALDKVGMLYSPQSQAIYDEVSQAASRLGVKVAAKSISDQKDIPEALGAVTVEAKLFLMIADPGIYIPKTVEFLLNEGLQKGFAVLGLSATYTKAGAFISYDCDYDDIGAQTADLAIRVMNKDPVAQKEITKPRKMKTSLNIKVAQRIGIKIPQEILDEAEEVIGK